MQRQRHYRQVLTLIIFSYLMVFAGLVAQQLYNARAEANKKELKSFIHQEHKAIRADIARNEQQVALLQAGRKLLITRDSLYAVTIQALKLQRQHLNQRKHEIHSTIDAYTDSDRQRYFTEHYPATDGVADTAAGRRGDTRPGGRQALLP